MKIYLGHTKGKKLSGHFFVCVKVIEIKECVFPSFLYYYSINGKKSEHYSK